ncbi:MAG TPA: SHOCT domain-containing protein [Glaciibacter sp.]|nr:SHOCT domain-containing protein [Glaciibacter sp.]
MDFWDFLWLFFWGFIFFAYLMVLFAIIGDIFRDPELNGWLKAVWTIFLVFLPILTALVYVIARGQGMARRQTAAALEARSEADTYIRSVAVSSPADEIAKAKNLLDSGSITQAEFDALKARALAGQR